MAGIFRPKCPKCNKWYRFDRTTEKMVRNCDCMIIEQLETAIKGDYHEKSDQKKTPQ